MDKLEELKAEATDLGIKFNPNISEAKLQEKIDAFYKSQEAGTPKILEDVVVDEPKGSSVKVDKELAKRKMIADALKRANETKIITITDNDQRINHKTSVAVVNCSNAYFDLGTARIPLNMPVEVKQGYIDVLNEIMIPMHVIDTHTGLSRTERRRRYSIHFEDIEKQGA